MRNCPDFRRLPQGRRFPALTPIASHRHRHQFYMSNDFPFLCQVNICKSSTHTNEIILTITNIFLLPCFIA